MNKLFMKKANKMKNEQLILIVNVFYVVWFTISFASFVMTRPLSLFDNSSSSITITTMLTSVYNFSALAICGVLIAILMKKKEKLIPLLLGLIAGLSNLFTGLSLLFSGRIDYMVLNPLIVGICTTTACVYIIIKTCKK